ncbi:hypothetical protein QQP08_024069 [Theobroma cacao]|nr:hypothetical protein QQP08_024069 [Theobroma cacao]
MEEPVAPARKLGISHIGSSLSKPEARFSEAGLVGKWGSSYLSFLRFASSIKGFNSPLNGNVVKALFVIVLKFPARRRRTGRSFR